MKRAMRKNRPSRNNAGKARRFDTQNNKKEEDFLFYYKRGVEWSQKGIYDLALADFTKSILLKDDFAKAYYGRAAVFNALKEYDKAKKDFLISHNLLDKVRFFEECAKRN